VPVNVFSLAVMAACGMITVINYSGMENRVTLSSAGRHRSRQFLAVIRDELLSHFAMAAVGALVALAVVAVVS